MHIRQGKPPFSRSNEAWKGRALWSGPLNRPICVGSGVSTLINCIISGGPFQISTSKKNSRKFLVPTIFSSSCHFEFSRAYFYLLPLIKNVILTNVCLNKTLDPPINSLHMLWRPKVAEIAFLNIPLVAPGKRKREKDHPLRPKRESVRGPIFAPLVFLASATDPRTKRENCWQNKDVD